jgi:transposase-like protein
MHGTSKPLRLWFRAMYLITASKTGVSAKTLQRELGISYPTAWTWLHKLRQAMVVEGRTLLSGTVETDETMLGKDRSRRRGRRKGSKAIVVIAVEDRGKVMGRARMATVQDFSSESLHHVIERDVAPGSTVHTDGWEGYSGLAQKGYRHEVDVLSGPKTRAAKAARAAEAFPHVHQLAGLLKRWLLGTHQGAVREKHLQAYLDEFVFRFNRRRSHRRTLLFERLAGQVVGRKAKPYWRVIGREARDQPLHLAAA